MADPKRSLELIARAGLVVKGVLYAIVGILAWRLAAGLGGKVTSLQGALVELLRQPFGSALILAAAIGLFGYTAWRTLQGFLDTDRRGRSWQALGVRSSYVARGAIHAVIGWKALQLYRGVPSRAPGPDDFVSDVFAWPLGQWLVLAAGLGLLAYALYQLYRAWAGKLGKHFDATRLRREMGNWAIHASRAGIAARGLVFVVLAWYLLRSGWNVNPAEVAGSAEAIRVLGYPPEPFGSWLLGATGLGLLAYGLYELLQARYRTVRVS
jgi:hypothetical protein